MKPILFNTGMVTALLEGRKTVTRRLIKPQPGADAKMAYTYAAGRKQDCGKWRDLQTGQQWNPPYHAEDVLYVRETWCLRYDGEKYFYLADKNTEREEDKLLDYADVRWHPSIHMPKEAARIFLKVKSVRLERLQDITDAEALKEGCTGLRCDHPGMDEHGCVDCYNTGWLEPPVADFMYLWDYTIKPADLPTYGWEANPWVFVIEFERISKEEALK